MDGIEWQIDAPWRLEPNTASPPTHDPIPIVITFGDAAPEVGAPPRADRLHLGRFCGLYVLEGSAVTLIDPAQFHEIEGSRRWLVTGELTPGPNSHIVRKIWHGESPEDVIQVSDWAEWNATAMYHPQSDEPGATLGLIAMARISRDATCGAPPRMTQERIMWQLQGGRESNSGFYNGNPPQYSGPVDASASEYMFGDFLLVHLAAAPLPKFDDRWAYGDIHYHSQGTDNEGESGIAYRPVLQAMKAMGLDYVFATEHASDSPQITGIFKVFLQLASNVPGYLEPVAAYIEQLLRDHGLGIPVPQADAYRDMSLSRFRHLYDWLHLGGGANEDASSGGGTRTPRLYLGGEVDVIPEISNQERQNGVLSFAYDQSYLWSGVCRDLPEFVNKWFDYSVPENCGDRLIYPGSAVDSWSVRDVQGLGPLAPSRQHLVYLPYLPDPGSGALGRDGFIASRTTTFGGASRSLSEVIHTELEVARKGYIFLAHPAAATTGNGVDRLGPDMVPYSDTQLRTAFRSPYVLGLQAWNEDIRQETSGAAGSPGTPFPLLWGQGSPDPEIPMEVEFTPAWHWDNQGATTTDISLNLGTRMWDQMLRWGIRPSMTADLPWLVPGAPRKVFLAGGSDAHGDLNYRRLGAMLGLSGANDTAIGKPRNLTYVGSQRLGAGGGVGQNQAVDGLRSGQFVVTDGPALRIVVDANRNGVIDDADVPMGGDFAASGDAVPLLVEWKSTAEFGPVTLIELIVGAQAADHDGLVYAPYGHGTRGGGPCKGDRAEYDVTGTRVCVMADGYVRDPDGGLSIAVPAGQGMAGVRSVSLNPNTYRLFDQTCEVQHVEVPTPHDVTLCHPNNVRYPERLYVRAVAKTTPGAAPVRRMAYTNPIWITATAKPSPPNLTLAHLGCDQNVNQFTLAAAPGVVPGTITVNVKVGAGEWTPWTSGPIVVPGGQNYALRAHACNANGCSDDANVVSGSPTCIPPPPDAPYVAIEFQRCSSGNATYVTTVSPIGIGATTLNKQVSIGGGPWTALTSTVVTAGSGQSISLQAQACSIWGCSAFASAWLAGPTCGRGGGQAL